jgi:hypothetical protein
MSRTIAYLQRLRLTKISAVVIIDYSFYKAVFICINLNTVT